MESIVVANPSKARRSSFFEAQLPTAGRTGRRHPLFNGGWGAVPVLLRAAAGVVWDTAAEDRGNTAGRRSQEPSHATGQAGP